MTFEVIPAVDISRGRLVRMSGGEILAVEAFARDPLAAAKTFVDAGAPRLHVVDVDLAATGTPGNLDALASIAALGVPVQASGGVSSSAHVLALLAAGADRVVLGSAALAERELAERAIREFGARLCVGIEADGPTIHPRGGDGLELPLWDALVWLEGLEVPRYVFTEVGRAGEMAGPDLDGVWALATHTERPVLAAGGIRSVEDVAAVAGLGGSVEGLIVGRALYEGLDLAEALRATS